MGTHLVLAIGALAILPQSTHAGVANPEALSGPKTHVAPGFWDHWGDGRAELNGYRLTQPRYGELRRGTAVAIFVTETMDPSTRVKTDQSRPGETLPVMKLNLFKDFQTGIYDYQTMLTVFWSLAPFLGRDPGSVAKAVFSSQEWCGQVFHQLLPDRDGLHSISHSYFEGEGDQNLPIARPADGIFRDELFLLVRGFLAPPIENGGSVHCSLLTGLEAARLGHSALVWQAVEIHRSSEAHTIEVPAGAYDVDRYSIRTAEADLLWIDVESDPPHRVIRWETRDGEIAELAGSTRLTYWQLQGNTDITHLPELGLAPPVRRAAGGVAP